MAYFSSAMLAGKAVTLRTANTTSGPSLQYIYPQADTLFVFQGRQALIEEALGQLP